MANTESDMEVQAVEPLEKSRDDNHQFESLLNGLPPPQKNNLLRVTFALVFGAGLRCRGVYVANVLLALVLFAGSTGAAFQTYLFWSYYWPSPLEHGGRSHIDVALRTALGCLLLVLLIGTFVYVSVAVYYARGCLDVQSPGFPAPQMRKLACRRDGTTYACRRTAARQRRGVWLLLVVAFIIGALELVFVLGSNMELAQVDHQPVDLYALARISAYVFWTWSVLASGVWITTFYAIAEDLTLVLQHVTKRISHVFESTECPPVARFPDRHVKAMEMLYDFQRYSDFVLKPMKPWFVFQMMSSFLLVLIFAVSSVFVLLATATSILPMRTYYDILAFVIVFFQFISPLYAATRLTSSWHQMLQVLGENRQALGRWPAEYHTFLLYANGLKGGFVICGHSVELKLGLQVVTIIAALAGMAQYMP